MGFQRKVSNQLRAERKRRPVEYVFCDNSNPDYIQHFYSYEPQPTWFAAKYNSHVIISFLVSSRVIHWDQRDRTTHPYDRDYDGMELPSTWEWM
jgi:hypothetical protein